MVGDGWISATRWKWKWSLRIRGVSDDRSTQSADELIMSLPVRRPDSITPADALLLRLVKWDWDGSPWPADSIDDATDWTAVVQRALHHGVAELLCRSLRRLQAGEAPENIVAAAAAYLENADARGAERVAQLFSVLDTLNDSNIPAMPFKGPVLGVLAHANAGVRPSRDLDVLVRRADMGPAVSALAALGYRLSDSLSPRITEACFESYGQDILSAEGRYPVEPHWAFAPRALAVDLDLDGLWSRAQPLNLAGRSVLTLSLEDSLLTACLHGGKEKWWRLLWVADVAAFIHRHPALDWTAVMERAQASGMRRLLLLGLAMARDLFSSVMPPYVERAIDEDRRCLELVQMSRRHLFAPDQDVGSVHHLSRYHWRARERLGDRARYVWRILTTPQFIHYHMIKLPEPMVFAYPLVKLVHDYLLLPLWRLGRGRRPRSTPASTTDRAG